MEGKQVMKSVAVFRSPRLQSLISSLFVQSFHDQSAAWCLHVHTRRKHVVVVNKWTEPASLLLVRCISSPWLEYRFFRNLLDHISSAPSRQLFNSHWASFEFKQRPLATLSPCSEFSISLRINSNPFNIVQHQSSQDPSLWTHYHAGGWWMRFQRWRPRRAKHSRTRSKSLFCNWSHPNKCLGWGIS